MNKHVKTLRDQSDENLKKELLDTQKRMFDLRSQRVTAKLEKTSEVGKARRQVARIKTLLHQRTTAGVAK